MQAVSSWLSSKALQTLSLWFGLSVLRAAYSIKNCLLFCGTLSLCSEKHFFTNDIPMICPGWESQLLETGFLAIFLCPAWTLSQVPRCCPPSLISIWTFRWLIVRIMLGAVSKTLYRHLQGYRAAFNDHLPY